MPFSCSCLAYNLMVLDFFSAARPFGFAVFSLARCLTIARRSKARCDEGGTATAFALQNGINVHHEFPRFAPFLGIPAFDQPISMSAEPICPVHRRR
jgi:hypothetical protein